MKIVDVLQGKGAEVITVTPDTTVAQLLARLADHHIGAVVVSRAGTDIAGIISERDVVRRLHTRGPDVLSDAVAEVMTTDVVTCTVEDDLEDVARTMTERRFRHMPVVAHGELHGIVSIGDIVKNRIDQLQTERDQLVAYIQR